MNKTELIRQIETLKRQNRKEYQTMGNTQRCQELWEQIERLESELKGKRNG